MFINNYYTGLDATASIELLTHLNNLVLTNRTIVLTIHQPRFEIFDMFDKLILLSDGNIAYDGVPKKAYSFFVEAITSKFLDHDMLLPGIEKQNPAGIFSKFNIEFTFLFCRCYHGYSFKAMYEGHNFKTLSSTL